MSRLLTAIFACLSLSLQAQEADTLLLVRLNEVEVKSTREWASNEERYRFNQTRYYVTTILPYVHAATELFLEMDSTLSGDLRGRERRRYVKQQEAVVRARFEDQIKDLNETQGVLLIKLIARQTGLNIYSILNEFKNPLTAMKWQAWAKVNGFSIAKKYDPADEPLLESVMVSLGYP